MKGMPYCSNCGGKLPKDDQIYTNGSHTLVAEVENELSRIDIT
jgi:hypothetical protein